VLAAEIAVDDYAPDRLKIRHRGEGIEPA